MPPKLLSIEGLCAVKSHFLIGKYCTIKPQVNDLLVARSFLDLVVLFPTKKKLVWKKYHFHLFSNAASLALQCLLFTYFGRFLAILIFEIVSFLVCDLHSISTSPCPHKLRLSGALDTFTIVLDTQNLPSCSSETKCIWLIIIMCCTPDKLEISQSKRIYYQIWKVLFMTRKWFHGNGNRSSNDWTSTYYWRHEHGIPIIGLQPNLKQCWNVTLHLWWTIQGKWNNYIHTCLSCSIKNFVNEYSKTNLVYTSDNGGIVFLFALSFLSCVQSYHQESNIR